MRHGQSSRQPSLKNKAMRSGLGRAWEVGPGEDLFKQARGPVEMGGERQGICHLWKWPSAVRQVQAYRTCLSSASGCVVAGELKRSSRNKTAFNEFAGNGAQMDG